MNFPAQTPCSKSRHGRSLLRLTLAVFLSISISAFAQIKPQEKGQETLGQVQADILAQRWDQAMAKLESASGELLNNSDFHFLLAAVLQHKKELIRAAQEIDRAVALDAKQARYYLLRGQVYEQAGELSAASADYQKSIELEPQNPAGVLLLAKLHVDKLRPADALPVLEQALKRLAGSAALHYELGRIQEMVGRPTDAMANYARALELNPRLALAHGGLGRLFRNQETLSRSAEHLEQALALEPQNPQWSYELGLTYVQQQKWESAQVALERAATLLPNEPRVYSALAQAYRERKMPEKARDALRRFGELASRAEKEKLRIAQLEADFMRAQDLQSSGQQKEAIALYQQILNASPDEPQVYFALARLYLDSRNPALAEEHIRRALKLRPDKGDYHELYAVTLVQLGRHKEAEPELRIAIALKPLEGSPNNLLGNLLLTSGRTDAAIVAYTRAVELEPEEPDYRLNLARAYRVKGDSAAAEREVEAYQKLLRNQQTPQ